MIYSNLQLNRQVSVYIQTMQMLIGVVMRGMTETTLELISVPWVAERQTDGILMDLDNLKMDVATSRRLQ